MKEEEYILMKDGKQVYANLDKDVYLEISVTGDDGKQKIIEDWIEDVVAVWFTGKDETINTTIRRITSETEIKVIKAKIENIKENEEEVN